MYKLLSMIILWLHKNALHAISFAGYVNTVNNFKRIVYYSQSAKK